MWYPSRRLAQLFPLLLVSLAAGCSQFHARPARPLPPPLSTSAMVAAIRAAGAREKSIINVTPLRDPAVDALRGEARRDELSGHYEAAAHKLDQALKVSPDSPDLLQDRAEIAVRLKDFSTAAKLAHRSWSLGPKLGPLCARNWQTIVELRLREHDKTGAATARRWVQTCNKPGIKYF